MSIETDILRALLQLTGRSLFPPTKLISIVMTKGSTPKQRDAYNLCDGSKSQAEIAKELHLDQGNFSRTVQRWLDAGVLFKFGEGRETKLLHLYRLPELSTKARTSEETDG